MTNHLKIIADQQIPGVTELFSAWGEVVQLPGRSITHEHVADADILLVRSITPVNQILLHNSRIKFVGSGTAGINHMDIDWLQHNHIAYATAKGCNAIAVAEYVVCCVAALQKQGLLTGNKLRAGVVGMGHVGTEVVQRLKTLGFELLGNDPPRAQQEPDFISTPLSDFQNLDLICLHTPLTTTGEHPTHRLIGKDFLQRQRPGCVLLNAGRGEVIAIDELWQYGQHLVWCLDVWPHEPAIDLALANQAKLATPHIAGYTAQAKWRAVLMLYQAAQWALQLPRQLPLSNPLAVTTPLELSMTTPTWQDTVLAIYDPWHDTEITRSALLNCGNLLGKCFDDLRQHHPQRYEFNNVRFQGENAKIRQKDKEILEQLGFGDGIALFGK
jgi:erythronate-4-phosphate dehydrogenase